MTEILMLSSVCNIVKQTPQQFDGCKEYVATGDLQNSKIISSTEVTYQNRPSRADCTVNSGDVLFARMAGTEKTLIAKKIHKDMLFSTGFAVLRPIPKVLDSAYLYHILRSEKFLLQKDRLSSGATQKAITNKSLLRMKISIPPLDEQKRIAAILDKASEIASNSKKFSDSKNRLIESVFLSMFGDPEFTNCDIVKLQDVISTKKNSLRRGPFGGALKKEIFVEEGYLVYEQRHAIHNDFEFARYYINEEKYRELESFSISPGDLLVSCSGVTLGRIAEIPVDASPGIINQALLKISLNKAIICNEYFIHLFRSKRIQERIFGVSRGSGIPNFPPLKQIKGINIPLPPLEVQLQFAKIVDTLERVFDEKTTSKFKIENLGNSIQQEELT